MPDLLNRNDQSLIVSMLERASLVEDGHGRAALITESGLNSADFDLDGTPHNFAVMFIDRLVNVEHRSALGVVLNRISSRYGAVPVDLDRLRREIFGNGFDQNEAAPPSPISGTPIAAGLNALTALTADPEIREAALRFRTVFQTSREQIAVVTGYKGLHDRLHELRDKCVEPMTRALPGFPRDEDVRTEFDEYRITLEGIMRQLHTRTAEFHSADTSWISSFDSALEDVRRALSGLDDVLLKRVLRNLDRELAMRLTRINSDLNASARALRLNDLVLALHEICEHGDSLGSHPEALGRIRTGSDTLANMAEALSRLVYLHDQWQNLDDLLRAVANNQTPEDVDYLLPDFNRRIGAVSGNSSEPWAISFRADFEEFSRSAQTQSVNQLARSFRLVRRQVKISFYNMDSDLKDQCDQLRTVAEPLIALLDELA